LGSRARGEAHGPRWDGSWEGWLRDPTVSSADDVIARCEPQTSPATAAPSPPTAAPPLAAVTPTATRLPDAAALAPDQTTIRVGAWNLASPAPTQADFAPVAAAIEANFDILAISELRQSEYDGLLGALGSAWSAMISSAPPHSAVLYRRARVAPCAGWETLRPMRERAASGAPEPGLDCFEAEVVDVGVADRLPIAVRLRAKTRR
jgi:hypothetical protein